MDKGPRAAVSNDRLPTEPPSEAHTHLHIRDRQRTSSTWKRHFHTPAAGLLPDKLTRQDKGGEHSKGQGTPWSAAGPPHQPLSSSAFPVCLPPPRSASRELRGARLQLSLMGPSSMGTEPCKASRIPQHVMFPQTCVRPGVPYTETMPVSLWDERGH